MLLDVYFHLILCYFLLLYVDIWFKWICLLFMYILSYFDPFIITCATLALKVPWQGNYFGHAFDKAYQYHYKKSCLSKSHYLTTKTLKITHIQLLCNYPLSITITMQLSP
jgi:hypothetical protein